MLVSAYLVPHGMQIIPGLEEPYSEGFRPLHEAMEQAGHDLRAEQPDLLLLLAVHGLSLPAAYAVYLNDRLQGLLYRLTESNVFGELGSRRLWQADRPAAEALLQRLAAAGLPAEGVVQGAPSHPITLAWGETVPLCYLAGEAGPRVVVISLPRKIAGDLTAMQGELDGLGQVCVEYARAFAGRVSLVVSGDLSHVHRASGPYGQDPSAPVFDGLAQRWARNPSRELVSDLLGLRPKALACGMAGICVLQTVLDATHLACTQATYAAPTYFGMMVAHWK